MGLPLPKEARDAIGIVPQLRETLARIDTSLAELLAIERARAVADGITWDADE